MEGRQGHFAANSQEPDQIHEERHQDHDQYEERVEQGTLVQQGQSNQPHRTGQRLQTLQRNA